MKQNKVLQTLIIILFTILLTGCETGLTWRGADTVLIQHTEPTFAYNSIQEIRDMVRSRENELRQIDFGVITAYPEGDQRYPVEKIIISKQGRTVYYAESDWAIQNHYIEPLLREDYLASIEEQYPDAQKLELDKTTYFKSEFTHKGNRMYVYRFVPYYFTAVTVVCRAELADAMGDPFMLAVEKIGLFEVVE